MPFKHGNPGCCDCSGGGGPTPCAVYCILVTDFTGSPVSGLSVAFTGHTGTSTPWSSTGTTDSSGQLCYTLPTTGTIPVITGATAYSPDVTCYATSGFTQSGTTCSAVFRYCSTTIIVNTLDGETGAGLSGVTLVGPFFVDSGESCITSTSTGEVVSGSVHTFTTYKIVNNSGGGCNEPDRINYVTSCKEGYWGGCLGVGTFGVPCQTTSYNVYLWDRSKWNLNVQGSCINGRSEVYPKKLCVTWGGPTQVLGGNAGTSIELDWDSASWDGDPEKAFITFPSGFTGPNTMLYKACVSANGAYGQCAGTKVNYANAYLTVKISMGRTGPIVNSTYQPLWVSCDPATDVAPTCVLDGTTYHAQPALYCPVPSPPNPPGYFYYQMPYGLTCTVWEGTDALYGSFTYPDDPGGINLYGPTVGNPASGVVSGWANVCAFEFCSAHPGGPGGETNVGNPDCGIPNASCTIDECSSYGYGIGILSTTTFVVKPTYYVEHEEVEPSSKRLTWV